MKKVNNVNIEKYLSSLKYTTRKELCERTGLSDRTIRDKISELKTKRVVIYSSQTKGYRLAKEYNSMSKIQREEEIRQIQHSLNDCKSRVENIKKSMRKYIAYIKKAEQIELKEQNYNNSPRID